jgi:hypothetical protein
MYVMYVIIYYMMRFHILNIKSTIGIRELEFLNLVCSHKLKKKKEKGVS